MRSYDHICSTCKAEHYTDASCNTPDEDFEQFDCPLCDKQLCAGCVDQPQAAFRCETCAQVFCAAHRKTLGGEHFCPACYMPALEAAYESLEADLAAAKREIAAYKDTFAEIVALPTGPGDIIRAKSLGEAQGIAITAPLLARAAAVKAA